MSVLVSNQLNGAKSDYEAEVAKLRSEQSAKTQIVVAAQDIKEGETITQDKLSTKEILSSKTPLDAIGNEEMIIGRIARHPIAATQVISSHDLALRGVSLGFESRLEIGQRAVTFAVDTNSGVAGFITPDSRVDVMSMVGSGANTRVGSILSDVKVIAVGQMYEKAEGSPGAVPVNSVTVAVSPEDCKELVKGIASSKLYLALRNQNDHTPVVTVDVTSLFTGTAKEDQALKEQLATIPPPDAPGLELPMPAAEVPEFSDDEIANAGKQLTAPPSPYEVEMWSGSSKAVLAVPHQSR